MKGTEETNMGAGVHGGFGHTKGYSDAVSLSANLINANRTNERLHINAQKIKPEQGYYDVVIHGKEDSFLFYHPDKKTNNRENDLKGWADISHRTISKYVKNQKDYKGESIRLISCETGKLNNGVAQNLANKLKVNVKAPSDTVWVHPNGKLTIGKRPSQNTGAWNIFKPKNGRRK